VTARPPRAPAAEFRTAQEAAPTRPALVPAPLLRRLAAAAYEALLLTAVLIAAGFLLAPIVSPTAPGPGPRVLQIPSLPARVVSFAVLCGLGAAYFGWFWSGGRRTLPMKTWRLRLVADGGTAVSLTTALVRYGAAWIGPASAVLAYAAFAPSGHARSALWLVLANFAWALVDPDRQFLHDRIAGTRIVIEPRAR
jgi:uncharacterized RDD family membrane protein YckC